MLYKKLLSHRGERRQRGQHGVPSVARTQGHLPALYLAIIIWLVCLLPALYLAIRKSSPSILGCPRLLLLLPSGTFIPRQELPFGGVLALCGGRQGPKLTFLPAALTLSPPFQVYHQLYHERLPG